jgi:hypothetical protein
MRPVTVGLDLIAFLKEIITDLLRVFLIEEDIVIREFPHAIFWVIGAEIDALQSQEVDAILIKEAIKLGPFLLKEDGLLQTRGIKGFESFLDLLLLEGIVKR